MNSAAMGSRQRVAPARIVRVGLAAGLLLNVLGWIGNQLVLGPLWNDAILQVAPLRSRTWVNELVSLVPDFVYGVAMAGLFVVLATQRGMSFRTALTAALAVWLVAVVPTYLGIANSGLLPLGLAFATTVVGLLACIPTAWLVWKRLAA